MTDEVHLPGHALVVVEPVVVEGAASRTDARNAMPMIVGIGASTGDLVACHAGQSLQLVILDKLGTVAGWR